VYCAVPDYAGRNEFWKSKLPYIKNFVFSNTRLIIFTASILVIWLDHRRVLAKRSRPSQSGLQLVLEGILFNYNSEADYTVFLLSVSILNTGVPTVARNWTAEYQVGKTSERMEGFFIRDTYTFALAGDVLTLTNDNLITAQTLTKQIPTGEGRLGRLLYTLPGNRIPQLNSLQFSIVVKCADFTGNISTGTFTPDPHPVDGIKMYPGEKLSKDAKKPEIVTPSMPTAPVPELLESNEN
jgi:hypothetical protein